MDALSVELLLENQTRKENVVNEETVRVEIGNTTVDVITPTRENSAIITPESTGKCEIRRDVEPSNVVMSTNVVTPTNVVTHFPQMF